MVSGHLGIAFAICAVRRDAPLPALVLAAIAPDILDGIYKLAGFYGELGLWSHSLPATAVLSGLAFALTFAITKRAGTAAAIALAVFLHLPADLITGEKLLWAGGPIGGLVWYEYPVADFLIEMPMAIAGWWLLRRDREAPRWATGAGALAFLVVIQVAFDILQYRAQ